MAMHKKIIIGPAKVSTGKESIDYMPRKNDGLVNNHSNNNCKD